MRGESAIPITESRRFELVTEKQWQAVRRVEGKHLDVGQAVRYLVDEPIGTVVRLKCLDHLALRKRDSARRQANIRHMKLKTRYSDGWLYIRKEKE